MLRSKTARRIAAVVVAGLFAIGGTATNAAFATSTSSTHGAVPAGHPGDGWCC